ncbi:acetyl-CoA carboxylase biotin carboxylase subunit [Paradesulfitobacterium aromaticivorans]
MIKKLLISNRGEIVRRIIKTCRDLDIKPVAIFSDADKDAFYLQEAHELYYVGPSNPLKSYLNVESIINVLHESGADAVHPGYGFLSENASFADEVVAAGALWVGPPPRILKSIESKSYCRQIAVAAGVPVVPGTFQPVRELDDVYRFVSDHGFPIIFKLDKGGGGKGIEHVKKKEEIKEVFERISRIGQMAFSSPDCYIEKEIIRPRHIEIQFIADMQGNCVCLGERECSLQRRYQKIIEESPSLVVSEQERQTLYDYTVRIVRAMGYYGAGTMEFLRADDEMYYFMEVNARLQVEHPVSEYVTGIDIVRNQLNIAAGEKLEIRKEDIQLNGHAIEARVYAEDPATFVPSPGTIQKLSIPAEDLYLRIDHALASGANVPPYYDPMLAKVIAWGVNRPEAINRLSEALAAFQIEGVKTTIPLNLEILRNEAFKQGLLYTGFIDDYIKRG